MPRSARPEADAAARGRCLWFTDASRDARSGPVLESPALVAGLDDLEDLAVVRQLIRIISVHNLEDRAYVLTNIFYKQSKDELQ